MNVILWGINQTQVIVYIFILILLAEKKIKETVLLNYILKYIFLHKMDSYAAKVVIQNE